MRLRGGNDIRQNFSLLDRAEAGDTNYRITLTWCDNKRGAVGDVDTYLSIPGVPANSPLYYGKKAIAYQGTNLDVDDVDWRGPETTTIHDLRDGTYVFYVNNYDTRGNTRALGNSEIKVQVYRDQVYRQVTVYLCGSCYRTWIEKSNGPEASPRTGAVWLT